MHAAAIATLTARAGPRGSFEGRTSTATCHPRRIAIPAPMNTTQIWANFAVSSVQEME